MRNKLLAACLAGLGVIAGGCNSFSDHATVVEGIVINAETGTPFRGIPVYLGLGRPLGSPQTFDAQITDATGRFRLEHRRKVKYRPTLEVYANIPLDFNAGIFPPNECYTTATTNVDEGKESTVSLTLRKTMCNGRVCTPECEGQ